MHKKIVALVGNDGFKSIPWFEVVGDLRNKMLFIYLVKMDAIIFLIYFHFIKKIV